MKNFYRLLTIIILGYGTLQVTVAQVTCIDDKAVYNENDVYAALPNVFTPDNDGINDLLVIYNSAVDSQLIRILDTVSNAILFESSATDETAFWDGLYENGMEAPEAAYNLELSYIFENGDIRFICRTLYLVRQNCINLEGVDLDFPDDFDETSISFLDTETTLPDCVLGVNELHNVEVTIQPTIAKHQIIVNSTVPFNNLKVYDLNGKALIFNNLNTQFNFEVNVDALETGAYFLFLDYGNKYSIHQFFKE